jgi:hypothetical protein
MIAADDAFVIERGTNSANVGSGQFDKQVLRL